MLQRHTVHQPAVAHPWLLFSLQGMLPSRGEHVTQQMPSAVCAALYLPAAVGKPVCMSQSLMVHAS